jgi:phytoene dehydrogenase-like protein
VRVRVHEAQPTFGGGLRSAELTLPGFVHDVCSAIHPLAVGSPFLRGLRLGDHGLQWIHPEAPLAHPFDDGTAVVLERSIADTARGLGRDGVAYERLMGAFTRNADALFAEVLAPPHLPRHPLLLARFGALAVGSAERLAARVFREPRAAALFAGIAGHSNLPLGRRPSAAFALVLGVAAHAYGWPMPRGGAGNLSAALVSLLRSHGGEARTECRVEALEEVEARRAVLLDLVPRDVARIAEKRLPRRFRRGLGRYRHGPGVFKIDYALDGPIPWRAAECARAATIHLGGTLGEISDGERLVDEGKVGERPFVILVQHSLFDVSRAPAGKHTAWAYCHVPNASTADMTSAIEGQIERFAPGFRDHVIGRRAASPETLERRNANLVGGDIGGGVPDLRQLFMRPTIRWPPYATPAQDLFLCSAATPPGPGVHGMCGFHAARAVLRRRSS